VPEQGKKYSYDCRSDSWAMAKIMSSRWIDQSLVLSSGKTKKIPASAWVHAT
jgi:hypothetical protein